MRQVAHWAYTALRRAVGRGARLDPRRVAVAVPRSRLKPGGHRNPHGGQSGVMNVPLEQDACVHYNNLNR